MVTVSPPTHSVCSPLRTLSTSNRPRCFVTPRASRDQQLFSSKLISWKLQKFPRIINCRSSGSGDSVDENESRTILDAFFLGKAFAEALNERIESSVGEFLSTIGRLQAEQQKQVQEFQDEVLEKAKQAKEKAAREAMEAKGLIPKVTAVEKPPAVVETPPVNGVASESTTATDSIDII